MSGVQSYAIFETALGFVTLAWRRHAVTCLRLPAKSEAAAEHALLRRLPEAERSAPPAEIASVIEGVTRYFAGAETDFSGVEVDLGPQEPFFAHVYERVRGLGWGQTTTYGAVAKELSADPRAARDVGQAMAANPVPLIVPCHRVLAAGDKIGGFSAPGGSRAKTKMLELEGVRLVTADHPQAKQLSLPF